MSGIELKICHKCGEYKPLDSFGIDRNKKDGLCVWCKECTKEYRLKNSEKIRRYRQENKIKNTEYQRNYYKEHQKRIREQIKVRRKTKWINDPNYRLNISISFLIYRSLKQNKNGHHWEKLIGYTLQELKQHLEKQFSLGMTWENYGKWHIDHLIPISLFNITGIGSKGFKKAWALENLQPLWAEENIKKSNKIFVV